MRFKFGAVSVDIGPDATTTTFPDGQSITGDHREQPGQRLTALEIGYPSAEALNRDHDLSHSLLACIMGLEFSPTLFGIATGRQYEHWHAEEAAVLGFQEFCNAVGVRIEDIAERHSTATT
jgi:hypothetical protein